MGEILLEAELRAETGSGKARSLRSQGFIPAVIYREGKESHAIKISHKEFLHLVHQFRLENAIIKLKIKDDKKSKDRACIIKEMQHDPVKGEIVHIDFNEISLTKVIKVNVPVSVQGESVGVKQDGGSVEHLLWEIEIECLPTDIPKDIPVDISNLKIGDSVHIKDIKFPSNLKVINEPGAIVLTIAAPMKEEVVAPVEGEEVSQEPEVIKEKKEVAEEGEAVEAKEEKKKEEKK